MLELMMMPSVDGSSSEGGGEGGAPPPSLGDAVPVAGKLPPKNVEPTDKLMIGWVRWALSLPWLDGPIEDQTGEHCADAQHGPVWYLAGTSGGPVVRECDIPAGKQLFFPLMNSWFTFAPMWFPTEEVIAGFLPWLEGTYDAKQIGTCALTLRVDGQDMMADFEMMNEDLYIRVSEPFEIDLHDEHSNSQYFAGGIMMANGAGHYALLQPLTPGEHVLEFGGSNCGVYPFSTSATYLLHVSG
jgi:hypothetical protein